MRHDVVAIVATSLHGSGRNGGQQGLPVDKFIDLGVTQYTRRCSNRTMRLAKGGGLR